MSLLTRCPACATIFRVTEFQLDSRQGFVRCGQCAKVFDARASLMPEAREEIDAPVEDTAGPPSLVPAPELPAAQALVPDESAAPSPPPADDQPAGVPEAAAGPASRPLPERAAAADAAPAEPLPFGPKHRARSRAVTALWVLGSLLALAGLAAQAAYWFRTELTVAWPETKPYLERACAALGCDVPPPRRTALISIESSDLQVDRNVPGLLTLNATLRNRAAFAQAHPSIELTLTDAEDRPLARRVLAPRDYLGDRLAREPLFAPASEYPVSLHIDATATRPAGYRLFLFHP